MVQAPSNHPILLVGPVNVSATVVELARLWCREAVDVENLRVPCRLGDLIIGVGRLHIAVLLVLGIEVGLVLAQSLSSCGRFLLSRSVSRGQRQQGEKGRRTSIFLNMRSLYSCPSSKLRATKNSFLVLLAARPGAIHSTHWRDTPVRWCCQRGDLSCRRGRR